MQRNPDPDPTATPAWDKPIQRSSRQLSVPLDRRPTPGRTPTVEQAIDAWLSAHAFAPPTTKAARQHLESDRASGWRRERGIATIDEFSADEAAAYITYLRDRGAAPATLRKVRTLLSSLAEFCAETPGYEAGLQGDAMRSLLLPVLVERIPRR